MVNILCAIRDLLQTIFDKLCDLLDIKQSETTTTVELVCLENEEGTGELFTSTMVTAANGTSQPPVLTATGIDCPIDEPVPNHVVKRECREDGFVWMVVCLIDEDGQLGEPISERQTTEQCDKDCRTPEVWCRVSETLEIDNHSIGEPRPLGPGIVAYPTDDHVGSYVLSNGAVISNIPVPAVPNNSAKWGAWNTQHSTILSGLLNKPDIGRGVRGPDGNPATPWGAFAQVECCPGDVTIVAATLTVSGGPRDGRVVPLLVHHKRSEPEYFTVCRDCDGNVEWRDSTGELVEEPPTTCLFKDCIVPAAPMLPQATPCNVTTLGPLCAFDEDGQQVQIGVFLDVEDCNGKRTRVTYTLPGGAEGDPELYTPPEGITVQNCDGSEIEEPPEPPCSEPTIVTCPDPKRQVAVYVNGRPVAEGWSWPGIFEGPGTLAEMEAALTAAGYVVTLDGLLHYACPPPPGAPTVNGEPTKVNLVENPDPDFVPVDTCAMQTVGKNDDRIIELLEANLAKQCELNDFLMDDCDDVKLLEVCQSYSNPVASGYNNWADVDEVKGLADEFGISPTAAEMWVRIIEFDCNGTAQSQVGQIFGPYPIPQPNAADQLITDIGAAIAGTCMSLAPGSSGGVGGGSNIAIGHANQNATLVIQEGVTVGAGPQWFTSAQGFTVRVDPADPDNTVVGDFIVSDGVGATSTFAQDEMPGQWVEASDCAPVE